MTNNDTKLIMSETSVSCIACFEDTLNRVSCCNAGVCEICYYEWLKNKRQCMHCKEDQCDFDIWVNKYRVEPEFNPQEYFHQFIQNNSIGNFNLDNMIDTIQHTLQETIDTPTEHTYLAPPDGLPPPNEPFVLQFGFTLAPTDAEGNPTGQGVTISQDMDYLGEASDSNDIYSQIQQSLQQYQQLFEQYNRDASPPSDGEVPPLDCIQQ